MRSEIAPSFSTHPDCVLIKCLSTCMIVVRYEPAKRPVIVVVVVIVVVIMVVIVIVIVIAMSWHGMAWLARKGHSAAS